MLFKKFLNFCHERKVALVRKSILERFTVRQVFYYDGRISYEVVEMKVRGYYRGFPLYGPDSIRLASFDSEEKAVQYLRELRNKQVVSVKTLGILSDRE
ncbi:hypothetical protein [Lactococcus ileimucosae]|uniref:hypothetical protein n=1 Tax=Lactococcus ileimucosae TaxID=2941329 RepID=UPI003513C00E